MSVLFYCVRISKMWFRICFCFLLAVGILDTGNCNEFEWLTTLLPEDSDSHGAEEMDSSLAHKDSTFRTSESPVFRSGSRNLNERETPDAEITAEPTLTSTAGQDALALSFVPLDESFYPYFKIAIEEIASSEERIKAFFDVLNSPHDVLNSPPPTLMLLDCIFSKRIREYLISRRNNATHQDSLEGNRNDRAYQPSTEGTTDYSSHETSSEAASDHSAYQDSTEGTTEYSSHQTLSEAATDQSTYSSDGSDYESPTPDLSGVRRSGLLNEEVSTEASLIRDCEGDCRQPPIRSGSIRGIPGEHFPDYLDIPVTTFSCAGKKRLPGFYADLETGCQVFHVCWPHKRETFLCPVGTTFNQAILSCDYWYSSNCSLAPLFFDRHLVPIREETSTDPPAVVPTEQTTTTRTLPKPRPTQSSADSKPTTSDTITLDDWLSITKFLPVKSKIIVYPESGNSNQETTKQPIAEWVAKQKVSVDREDKRRKLLVASRLLKDVAIMVEKVAREAQSYIDEVKIVNRARENSKMLRTKCSSSAFPSQAKIDPASLQKNKPCIGKSLPTINPRFIVKPVGSKVATEKPSVTSASPSPTKSTEASVNQHEEKTMVNTNIPTSSIPTPAEASINRHKVSSEGKSMTDANISTKMPASDPHGKRDANLSLATILIALKMLMMAQ